MQKKTYDINSSSSRRLILPSGAIGSRSIHSGVTERKSLHPVSRLSGSGKDTNSSLNNHLTRQEQSSHTKKNDLRLTDIILTVLIVFLSLCGLVWIAENTGAGSAIKDFINPIFSNFNREKEENAPRKIMICVGDDIPSDVFKEIEKGKESLSKRENDVVTVKSYSGRVEKGCSAVISSSVEGDKKDFDLVWERYFVLAARYDRSTSIGVLTPDEVYRLLGEGAIEKNGVTYRVIVEASIREDLDRSAGLGVGVLSETDPTSVVLTNPTTLALIPFESLTPQLSEVLIGESNLRNRVVAEDYPLISRIWIKTGDMDSLFSKVQGLLGPSNYTVDSLRSIVVTGTSVVGARGWFMTSSTNGDWMYPLRNVGDILREASVAHISNEGSRVEGCTQYTWTLVFCGPPAAYEGLTWAGIDVVGLTGNHILDYGIASFNSTLDWYDTNGIKYFGGGRNITEAHRSAVFDLGTLRVAFVGYNMIPPAQYYATTTSPGSAQLQEASIKADIAAAKETADVVFVDMQWGNEYERTPNGYQTTFGRIAVDAGATVVSGVHPHWIQPVEYHANGLIFYSLGNFLFDQTWSQETREGVMVRHYFYDKSYLGYEIIPTRIDDEKQVDLVDGADKIRISGYVFGEQ